MAVDNRPLFHRKLTVWEGGIRMPPLIRWPGRIPPGRVSREGITMDLTASMLAATNTPVPPDARLEGIDLFPILEGRAPEVERTLFWRTLLYDQTQRAVRSGRLEARRRHARDAVQPPRRHRRAA